MSTGGTFASHDDRIAALRKVSFLTEVDDQALSDLAKHAKLRRFAAGQRIVSELEFGADVYVIVDGRAEISVEARVGERKLLGAIGPGSTFGEMASLTGELRSATVTALTVVRALIITDREFDQLRARRPEVAVALVRILANRLAEADRTLHSLLDGVREPSPEPPGRLAAHPKRGSLRTLWRELVVNRQKDLAFLTLVAFSATLVAVRVAVFLAFRYDFAPRDVLRAAYTSGFGLVLISGCAALFTFRPAWRRAIAVCFGIGAALICNELGVTLAFDIFYKDIHTPDPSLAFDVERLYRRTEPLRAIVIGLSVLIQAAYLRRFYVRLWFLAQLRLQHMLSRHR